MTIQQLYMIHCKSDRRDCYYSTGLHITSIPFEEFTKIKLQKITIVRQQNRGASMQIVYDLFPAFQRFQRAWRRRLKWIRNPRHILVRDLYGLSVRPPPFLQGLQ